jgi:2'-5' RNA ligase
MTLCFLGNVAAEKIPGLESSLREVSAKFDPMEMSAERVGCFPERGLPRVIWVGIHDAADRLQEFQHALQQATLEFGSEPPEKRFAGHVTVGRIKDIGRPQAQALVRAMAGLAGASFGQWRAPTVELIRSELSPAGATHTTLAALPFNTQLSKPHLS